MTDLSARVGEGVANPESRDTFSFSLVISFLSLTYFCPCGPGSKALHTVGENV